MALLSVQELLNAVYDSSTNKLNVNQTANVEMANGDAADFRTSAIQGDATNVNVSAKSNAANAMRVSSFSDDGGTNRVSAIQDGAAALNVSAKSNAANTMRISAFSDDGALNRVSAVQDGAAALNVSAKSQDAGLLRISAALFPSTVGGLTIFRALNLSASQNVKAAAGAVYGWHAWSNALAQQYIKLYNVSGAVNVGTDVPVMTIKLNVSGISDTSYDTGLVGFTNGIGIAAVSGVADDNTAASPASAVGINLYYK